MSNIKLKKLGTKGITLLGALAAILVLAILATQLGKQLVFTIKSKNRMEAKSSIIDNETTLIELIAARLKKMSLTTLCGFDKATFQAAFNDVPVVVFPAPSIQLKVETDKTRTGSTLKFFDNLLATAAQPGVQKDIQTALGSCITPLLPTPTASKPPVLTFCVALDVSNVSVQWSKNFVFSEAAFVQVRVDLIHQGLSQDDKTFGAGTLTCSDWYDTGKVPVSSRQFKFTYQIFWKAYKDPQGYYSYLGSKTFNLSELRSF